MLLLVTYDVSTTDEKGARRLRKVAKVCEAHGKRVQNSVFECVLDNAQSKLMKAELLEIMDKSQDSIRFYYLGNNFKNRVEHYGVNEEINSVGTLIF